MKKLLYLLTLIALPSLAIAEPVLINGIYYNIFSKLKQAEVATPPNNQYYFYSGEVNIPEVVTYENVEYDVTSIGNSAFQQSRSLTSVIIPNSVTTIGTNAFWGCGKLKSVTIPNSVISIGEGAFSGCKLLSSINIPNKITSIEKNLFYYCTSLTSIIIPNSVTTICGNAFWDCSGLTSIVIPSSVKSIGQSAFDGCSRLTSINLPNSVSAIDKWAFRNCIGLTSVTIPNSLTNIPEQVFANCTSLTSVTIPNSVTKIQSYAFSGCIKLSNVTIGSGVNTIGNAFVNCPELVDLYCLAENVPMASLGIFEDSYIEETILHVPAASIEAYKTSEPWSNFKKIVAIGDSEIPETPKCATPTITYKNGKINFSCETEGVEYVSTISAGDTKSYFAGEITLTNKYTVSVYATKDGYDKSETATLDIIGSAGAFGDLNKDGEVNVADHVELSKIILNQSK